MHPRQAPSKIYFPENVLFANAKSIPRDLLADVARCYSKRRTVCRQCYFDKGRGQILSDRSPTVPHVCAVGVHAWKPLCVIPRSEMCAGPSDWVAIFPSPTHMKEVNTAFAMCNKKDGHRSCLEMARTENPWFPHTVEEMVIWTIERERGGHGEGVSGHGEGVSGHGEGVSGHGEGVSGHGEGVSGHGEGVSGHGEGVSGHGEGVSGHGEGFSGRV